MSQIAYVFFNARITGDAADRTATYGVTTVSFATLMEEGGVRRFMEEHLKKIDKPLPEGADFELRAFNNVVVYDGFQRNEEEPSTETTVMFFSAVAGKNENERHTSGTVKVSADDLSTDDWMNRSVIAQIREQFNPPLSAEDDIDLRALNSIVVYE